jgi:hypothetical protein|tara:strand:+ start:1080 stop:1190 length:111 start_codon:yes stop_codon:yes gene_type:complete
VVIAVIVDEIVPIINSKSENNFFDAENAYLHHSLHG